MATGIHTGIVGNLQDYRMPSMKNVGKGPDGKAIPHFRSEEVAKIVAAWTANGADENFIAAMLNIRPGALRQHYANELMHGAQLANMQVASSVFESAVADKNTNAAKFWLKSRAGWRDGNDAGSGSAALFNIHIHA